MIDRDRRVAIVDHGMGNLYSVLRACQHVGMNAVITDRAEDIASAAGIVLPGVGAMADAMETLDRRGLTDPLREAVSGGRPFLGVCLGLQLLMSRGTEFGTHQGLGIFDGDVVRFPDQDQAGERVRVPHIGWNAVNPTARASWSGTPLEQTRAASLFYFVHSFYVVPSNPGLVVAETTYQGVTFASAVAAANVFACQFHPERSGPLGLNVYRSFAARVDESITIAA